MFDALATEPHGSFGHQLVSSARGVMAPDLLDSLVTNSSVWDQGDERTDQHPRLSDKTEVIEKRYKVGSRFFLMPLWNFLGWKGWNGLILRRSRSLVVPPRCVDETYFFESSDGVSKAASSAAQKQQDAPGWFSRRLSPSSSAVPFEPKSLL